MKFLARHGTPLPARPAAELQVIAKGLWSGIAAVAHSAVAHEGEMTANLMPSAGVDSHQ